MTNDCRLSVIDVSRRQPVSNERREIYPPQCPGNQLRIGWNVMQDCISSVNLSPHICLNAIWPLANRHAIVEDGSKVAKRTFPFGSNQARPPHSPPSVTEIAALELLPSSGHGSSAGRGRKHRH
jgi:hypothetical protein